MIKRKKILFMCFAILLIIFAFVSVIGSNVTSSAFLASGKVDVNAECGKFSGMFIVEIYDGDTLISEDDIQFDKEYTIKIYNKSNIKCNFYLTTEGTEINTFSNYVSIIITEDYEYNINLASTSSIRSGIRLSNVNKNIISVTNFKPSSEPMIYKMQISTASVKVVIQNAPSRITDFDFDLSLKFIANTTN